MRCGASVHSHKKSNTWLLHSGKWRFINLKEKMKNFTPVHWNVTRMQPYVLVFVRMLLVFYSPYSFGVLACRTGSQFFAFFQWNEGWREAASWRHARGERIKNNACVHMLFHPQTHLQFSNQSQPSKKVAWRGATCLQAAAGANTRATTWVEIVLRCRMQK